MLPVPSEDRVLRVPSASARQANTAVEGGCLFIERWTLLWRGALVYALLLFTVCVSPATGAGDKKHRRVVPWRVLSPKRSGNEYFCTMPQLPFMWVGWGGGGGGPKF